MEEFGISENITDVYASWYSEVVSSGLTGDLIWYVVYTLVLWYF